MGIPISEGMRDVGLSLGNASEVRDKGVVGIPWGNTSPGDKLISSSSKLSSTSSNSICWKVARLSKMLRLRGRTFFFFSVKRLTSSPLL
jgi:hypothetical protein